MALEFASDRLKDDKDVVKDAIKSTPYAIEFASDNLKEDEEVQSYYKQIEKESSSTETEKVNTYREK